MRAEPTVLPSLSCLSQIAAAVKFFPSNAIATHVAVASWLFDTQMRKCCSAVFSFQHPQKHCGKLKFCSTVEVIELTDSQRL